VGHPDDPMIRFGAPVFLRSDERAAAAGESHGAAPEVDPAVIARAHSLKGYTAAYAPAVKLTDGARIRAIRKAFETEGVMIAEVGYWENLVDSDPDVRRANRRRMVEALALAEELGARCAVDTFGSYCRGPNNTRHVAENFSEAAFEEAVEMARDFIDEVKPRTAHFTYEIFPFDVVDSPSAIARLVKAVDRRQFGVHLDLANLINSPRAYFASGAIMEECVRLFGERIVAAHGKDVMLREPAISVLIDEVIPGQGGMDIAAFVRGLHRLPQQVPLMLEHLANEQEYDQGAAHYRRMGRDQGILF
jgi:sugar phosphate isomerase/epimerase